MSEKRLSVEESTIRGAFGSVLAPGPLRGLERLAGDASTREYHRITDGSGRSFVLQVAEPFAAGTELRHPFIAAQALLKSWKVDVPEILASRSDFGWVLQEDLGDRPLQNEPTEERYRRAIDWILAWSAVVPESGHPAPHFSWAFDLEKLQFEMGFTEEHFFGGILGRKNSGFKLLMETNSQWLAARPRVFCHRDYHSRNLMIKDERLVVIDFQDARMGPASYDIVSLLWDPYVRLSERERAAHLDYWRTGLSQLSSPRVSSALEKLEIEVERMKIQRLLKAIGSYASFLRIKGRADYLPAVRPALSDTLTALERLRSLGNWSTREAELLTLLQSVDLELIDKLAKR